MSHEVLLTGIPLYSFWSCTFIWQVLMHEVYEVLPYCCSLGGEGTGLHLGIGKHGGGGDVRETGTSGVHGHGLESPQLKAGDVPNWDDGSGPGLPDKQLNQAVPVSDSDDEEEDVIDQGESDDGVPGLGGRRHMDEEEVGSVDESEIFMYSEEERMSSEDHDLDRDIFDDVDYTTDEFDAGIEEHLPGGGAVIANVLMGTKREQKNDEGQPVSPRTRQRAQLDGHLRTHISKTVPFYGSRRPARRVHAHRVLFEMPLSPSQSHADRRSGSGSQLDVLTEGDDEKDTDADVDEVGRSSVPLEASGGHRASPSIHTVIDPVPSERESMQEAATAEKTPSEKLSVLEGKSPLIAKLKGTIFPNDNVVGKAEGGGG
eukprot:TRINITY_DN15038_c0_g1_i2.p1 TRINITY_DN15038_c0_g1~~TRINITY_DN15038_c0_g1_i2.p1  ORF type:complete len:372 (+),score=85.48 TRINITY_DN15038_c0_g1_i2:267-1382(+)